MTGKDKCKLLKQIRRDIAAKNNLALTVAECTHKGDCAGTCPRCESEVAALEKALANRKKQGRQVVLAGISAGIVAVSCASCGPIEEFGQKLFGIESLAGDIAVDTTDAEKNDTTVVKSDVMGIIERDISDDISETDGELTINSTDAEK